MKCERCDYPEANEEPLNETFVRITCPNCGLDVAKPSVRIGDPCKVPEAEQRVKSQGA